MECKTSVTWNQYEKYLVILMPMEELVTLGKIMVTLRPCESSHRRRKRDDHARVETIVSQMKDTVRVGKPAKEETCEGHNSHSGAKESDPDRHVP